MNASLSLARELGIHCVGAIAITQLLGVLGRLVPAFILIVLILTREGRDVKDLFWF